MQQKDSVLEQKDVNNIKIANSKFGELKLDITKAINFSAGLLGMEDYKEFCLIDFPNPELEQFKILQSIEEDGLSFIILPNIEGYQAQSFIDEEDVADICNNFNIPRSNVAILFIASIHHSNAIGAEASVTRLSINTRAPLIVDIATKQAVQFVLVNEKYKIQHFIG